jgi:hypothetical protein
LATANENPKLNLLEEAPPCDVYEFQEHSWPRRRILAAIQEQRGMTAKLFPALAGGHTRERDVPWQSGQWRFKSRVFSSPPACLSCERRSLARSAAGALLSVLVTFHFALNVPFNLMMMCPVVMTPSEISPLAVKSASHATAAVAFHCALSYGWALPLSPRRTHTITRSSISND